MTEILRDWHDFYVLMGTAAATLIGLMFVAASIGAGLFTDEHKDMMKTFLTPTIVHFCEPLGAPPGGPQSVIEGPHQADTMLYR